MSDEYFTRQRAKAVAQDAVLLGLGIAGFAFSGPVGWAVTAIRVAQVYGAVHSGTKLVVDLSVPGRDLDKVDEVFGAIGFFGRWGALSLAVGGANEATTLRGAYRFQSVMDIGIGMQGGTVGDAMQTGVQLESWLGKEASWYGSETEFKKSCDFFGSIDEKPFGLDLGEINLVDPFSPYESYESYDAYDTKSSNTDQY